MPLVGLSLALPTASNKTPRLFGRGCCTVYFLAGTRHTIESHGWVALQRTLLPDDGTIDFTVSIRRSGTALTETSDPILFSFRGSGLSHSLCQAVSSRLRVPPGHFHVQLTYNRFGRCALSEAEIIKQDISRRR